MVQDREVVPVLDGLPIFRAFWWFGEETGTFAFECVDPAATSNHEEPGGKFAARGIKGFEAAKSFYQDVLSDVFGEALIVVEDGSQHVNEWVLISSDEASEGIGFSVQGPADNFDFFGFGHVVINDDTLGRGGGSIFSEIIRTL